MNYSRNRNQLRLYNHGFSKDFQGVQVFKFCMSKDLTIYFWNLFCCCRFFRRLILPLKVGVKKWSYEMFIHFLLKNVKLLEIIKKNVIEE